MVSCVLCSSALTTSICIQPLKQRAYAGPSQRNGTVGRAVVDVNGVAMRGHGAMNERPVPVDSSRQKGGVLVIRRHDDAVSFETAKVLGQSQGHSGAAARIRCISDCVLLELGHESDARIFYAPDFLGKLL